MRTTAMGITTTQTSVMGIHETVKEYTHPSLTALQLYADRDGDGCAIDLKVFAEEKGFAYKARTTGRWVVTWTTRSRGGWGKSYKATFDTRQAAEAFGRAKWEVIMDLFTKRPLQPSGGSSAAAVFSQSLAGMRA